MTHDTSGTQDVLRYLTEDENSQFAGQAVAILDRWQGRDNLLWRFESGRSEAVLKLFLEAGQVRADRQFSGQERFAPWGLAPRPRWQARQPEGLPRPVLVYEWSDGDALDLTNPDHADALLDAVVRVHGEEPGEHTRFSPHPINLAYFWRVLNGSRQPIYDWVQRQGATELGSLLEQLWAISEEWMRAALPAVGETAPRLIHGELMAENGLLHRGQAMLLDWEFFGLGDPAQEVARFLFYHAAALGNAGQAQWIERYCARMDDDGLPMRIDLYGRLLPFQSLMFLLNGVRSELAETPDAEALTESRAFLVETITATLTQAAETLRAASLPQDGCRDEIHRLLTL